MALANLADTANDTYVGGNFYMMWWKTGDALIKTGYVVGAHASNDNEIIICPTSAKEPAAVAALQMASALNTVLPDDMMIRIYMLGAGTALRLGCDTQTPSFVKGRMTRTSVNTAGLLSRSSTLGQEIGMVLKSYDDSSDNWVEVIT